MNRVMGCVGVGSFVVAVASMSLACGSGATSNARSMTLRVMEQVDDDLSAKAQGSCWFKVKNRSSRGEEVRLWNSTSSTGARTERLGELLMVTGAMDPPVRGERYYGCSLYEYTKGSPGVMTATSSPAPVRADTLIPYGFSREGIKELK